MEIIVLILYIVTIFFLFNVFFAYKRVKQNKKLLQILDQLMNESTFYQQAQQYIETVKNKEYREKMKTFLLWADTYYQHDDLFLQHLQTLEPQYLLSSKRFLNEDAFFYLYIAIPNRLYRNHKQTLIDQLNQTLQFLTPSIENRLFYCIHNDNLAFYQNQFHIQNYQSILDGDYGQFVYEKQLIAMYKNICATMLYRIYQIEKNQPEMQKLEDMVQSFMHTKLGERFCDEIGLEK